MKTKTKVLIGIIVVFVVLGVFALIGMNSSNKVVKTDTESAISRVESKSASSEAETSSTNEEASSSQDATSEVKSDNNETKPEQSNNGSVVEQPGKTTESGKTNTQNKSANKPAKPKKELTGLAYRYGTEDKSLWVTRDRILTNVYQHVHDKDAMAGFAVWLTEQSNGFAIYAGQQAPGQLIGHVQDHGNGSYTFTHVNGGTSYNFKA